MNLKNLLKIVFISAILSSNSVFSGNENLSIPDRIAALHTFLMKANITDAEKNSLTVEWQKLKDLYDTYNQDKKISKKEEKTLDSRINKFDLNLFRKIYD